MRKFLSISLLVALGGFVVLTSINQAQDLSAEEVAARIAKAGTEKTDAVITRVEKTEAEWAEQLTEEQFYVTRKKGTERAWSGAYNKHEEKGVYQCICCGADLFDSTTKFESGTGWPSYWAPISRKQVGVVADKSHGMVRTEIVCTSCDAHLGHVFNDGPPPTGLRYCVNSAALSFKAREDAADSTENKQAEENQSTETSE